MYREKKEKKKSSRTELNKNILWRPALVAIVGLRVSGSRISTKDAITATKPSNSTQKKTKPSKGK